jgi:hypothetical protein
MDRESFFDNLRDDKGEQFEALRAQRQLAYEERVIKRIFSECGIKISSWGRFANECRAVTGQDRLNFEWFNRRFPHFPNLSAKRIPRLHELKMQDLFRPSGKNRLFKAISKALWDRPSVGFVLVFPVTRMSFVAHDVEPDNDVKVARVVWSIQADPPLYVEPSKSFFQAFGSEWFDR